MGKPAELKMMVGTEGKADYLAVARRGAFALGLKPNQAIPGQAMGMQDKTWFGARIRAASAAGLIDDLPEDDSTNVVSFAAIPKAPGEAWSHIEWEKADGTRASAQIGVWEMGSVVPGSDHGNLLERLGSGTLAKDMANYVAELAGQDYLLVTPDEIAQWLQTTFFGILHKQLEKAMALNAAMAEEIKGSVGKFGVAAAMVKKAYDSVADDEEFEEDPEVGSEDVETDGEDGSDD